MGRIFIQHGAWEKAAGGSTHTLDQHTKEPPDLLNSINC